MHIERISLLTAALLAAAPAMAQMTPATYYSTPWGPVFTSRHECEKAADIPDMKTLDHDGDGKITSDEWEMSGNPDTSATLFDTIDKDHNGFITEKELDAYRSAGDCQETP